MPTAQRSLKIQFEKGASREETLLGRNYLVVPCIAMVEGVRFGANQTSAELGLASEFAEVPILWSNRPLVLNHPQVGDDFVSANSPDIMEEYQFGLTMNPELKDNKLHLEAWIDLDRVEELGGEFEETLQRIQDEEDVEVSVGFFCEVEKKKGKYRGQVYNGIWRNIKPDHLAILSDGILGACSVEDGCGIPRINQLEEANKAMAKELKRVGAKPTAQELTTQCGCGEVQAESEIDEDAPITQKGLKSMLEKLLKPFVQSEAEKAEEAHVASGIRTQREQIVAQAIAPHIMDGDVRKMISMALSKKFGAYNSYLLGFNQNNAIYERYVEGQGYRTYQLGINVTDSEVEFVGEPEEVILQTKIIPQAEAGEDSEDASEDEPTTQDKENDMSDEDKSKTQQQHTTQASSKPKVTQDPPPQVQTEPKVQSVDEYIANAPAEVREMLEASMKVHTEKKNGLVDRIFKAPSNKFTEEFLKTQSIEVLENMASLLPSSYKGLSVVNNGSNPRVQEESSEANVTVPRPQYAWGGSKKEGAA